MAGKALIVAFLRLETKGGTSPRSDFSTRNFWIVIFLKAKEGLCLCRQEAIPALLTNSYELSKISIGHSDG